MDDESKVAAWKAHMPVFENLTLANPHARITWSAESWKIMLAFAAEHQLCRHWRPSPHQLLDLLLTRLRVPAGDGEADAELFAAISIKVLSALGRAASSAPGLTESRDAHTGTWECRWHAFSTRYFQPAGQWDGDPRPRRGDDFSLRPVPPRYTDLGPTRLVMQVRALMAAQKLNLHHHRADNVKPTHTLALPSTTASTTFPASLNAAAASDSSEQPASNPKPLTAGAHAVNLLRRKVRDAIHTRLAAFNSHTRSCESAPPVYDSPDGPNLTDSNGSDDSETASSDDDSGQETDHDGDEYSQSAEEDIE